MVVLTFVPSFDGEIVDIQIFAKKTKQIENAISLKQMKTDYNCYGFDDNSFMNFILNEK